MTDERATVERLAYYHVPSADRVVQAIAVTDGHLTVKDNSDQTVWTLRREHFKQELAAGHIVEVVPNWEPARTVIEV